MRLKWTTSGVDFFFLLLCARLCWAHRNWRGRQFHDAVGRLPTYCSAGGRVRLFKWPLAVNVNLLRRLQADGALRSNSAGHSSTAQAVTAGLYSPDSDKNPSLNARERGNTAPPAGGKEDDAIEISFAPPPTAECADNQVSAKKRSKLISHSILERHLRNVMLFSIGKRNDCHVNGRIFIRAHAKAKNRSGKSG